MVANWNGGSHLVDPRQRGTHDRQRRWRGEVFRPRGCGTQLSIHIEPDVGALRARTLGEDSSHAAQQLLRRHRLSDALGELGKYLVGSRSLSIHDPIGETLRSSLDGLERDRHEEGGEDRQR